MDEFILYTIFVLLLIIIIIIVFLLLKIYNLKNLIKATMEYNRNMYLLIKDLNSKTM